MNTFAKPFHRNSHQQGTVSSDAIQTKQLPATSPGTEPVRQTLPESLNQSPQVQTQLQLQQSLNQSPRTAIQAKFSQALTNRSQPLQRMCDTCSEEEKKVKPKPSGMIEDENAVTQTKSANSPGSSQNSFVENRTGLPNQLKSGIEALSDVSLDDVNVHYNSSKPAQLQALAYTQGSDIHVAPGQEQHLAHEAWHVVQQKQGRVQPTTQLRNVAINDDFGLEREADVMGDKALQKGVEGSASNQTSVRQSLRQNNGLPLQFVRSPFNGVQLGRNNAARSDRDMDIDAEELQAMDVDEVDSQEREAMDVDEVNSQEREAMDVDESNAMDIDNQVPENQINLPDQIGAQVSGDVTTSESARQQVAEIARQHAISMVENVTNHLEAAMNQPEVQQHFLRVFQAPSVFQTFVSNLKKIAEFLKTTHLQINYRPNDNSSANAFTLQKTITLKTRFFTNLDQTEQRNTVIHEAVHAALKVPDYAYTTERLITALNPEVATQNPDSYVWFLTGLLEGKKEPKNQVQDIFTGEFSGPQKFEISKVIGIATSSFVRVQELFGQAAEDATQAVQTQRGFGNNTIYAIQQVKKVFTGASQNWNQNQPTQGIANGLNTISQMLTYLYGGLTIPVNITWADTLAPRWNRVGTGPVSLEVPKNIQPGNLYKSLMRNYIKDLLEPTKGEKWKQYYNLIVNVSPNFINLGNYTGTQMEALTPEI